MAESVDHVWRDYVTQGVPASGDHKPRKPEIRALLKQIQNSGGQSVTRNTLSALQGVTPPNENYMGVVLADAEPAKNGYYSRVSGSWVRGRGFPDTFAMLTGVGGTANAITASVSAGVNPADIELFSLVPALDNTSAVTVNGTALNGFDGAALEAGFIQAGSAILFAPVAGAYRLLVDHRFQMFADQVAEDRNEAQAEANRAETEADRAVIEAGRSRDEADRSRNEADRAAGYAAGIVTGNPRDFTTVAALLVDTGLSYSGSTALSVAAGDVITAQGFRYEVAAAGVTNQDIATAGGVKLYVLPAVDGSVSIAQFGAVGGGANDDTDAINKAFATGLNIHLERKQYKAGTLTMNTPRQRVFLNGADLSITALLIDDADDVRWALGGGTIRGDLRRGRLAIQAATGQNQLTFEDGHNVEVGDEIWCSYGDNGANFPLATPTVVTGVVGNVVTLAANLIGVVAIPVGTYIGNFTWSSMIDYRSSKGVNFEDGIITGARGYYISSWRWNQPDFLTNIPEATFSRVTFKENGLDQFIFSHSKVLFDHCDMLSTRDVAKTGIVFGDGADIEIRGGKIARGQFDSDFTPIADAGRGTLFQKGSRIYVHGGTLFDGANQNPTAQYFSAGCFHPLHLGSAFQDHAVVGGAKLGTFDFEDAEFVNYTRSAVSTTVIADTSELFAERVKFRHCKLNGLAPFQLKSTVGIHIPEFLFEHCDITEDGAYEFMQTQNPDFTAKFVGGTIKTTGDARQFINCELNGTVIYDSEQISADRTARFNDVTLRESGVRTAAIFGHSQFSGSFMIDNEDFAKADIGTLSTYGIITLQDGQGSGIKVRSVRGTLNYDVLAFGGNTFLIADVPMAWFGSFGKLVGDDWVLGAAQNVKQALGGQVKVTYSLPSTLSAAASAGAASLTVTTVSYGGNRPAAGDHMFIQLADGTVHCGVLGAYVDGSSTIPLTAGIASAAASGAGCWFMRIVAL